MPRPPVKKKPVPSEGPDTVSEKRRAEWAPLVALLGIFGGIVAVVLTFFIWSLGQIRELQKEIIILKDLNKGQILVVYDIKSRILEMQEFGFQEFQQNCLLRGGIYNPNQKACTKNDGSWDERFPFVKFDDFLWPKVPTP